MLHTWLGWLAVGAVTWARVAAAQSTAPPWWDNFARSVEISLPCGSQAAAIALKLNTDIAACSSVQDPYTGIWAQRVTALQSPDPQGLLKMRAAGLRTQSYFETFGQALVYVVQVKKNADGTYQKGPSDPELTRNIKSWWNWDQYDGTGEIRWAGAHGYFGDEDFARPYTLTHSRYGAPPVRYPDGTIANGYRGDTTDPRNSRIYDACAAKDVTGGLTYDYEVRTGNQQAGFVPVGSQRIGNFLISVDSACPSWADYARASALQAIDFGLDSVFTDNFGPWDSFGYSPVKQAFGEWSVSAFRTYLAAHFTLGELAALGIQDVKIFDVRAYLRAKAQAWSGSPVTSGGGVGVARSAVDAVWRDARWLDEPVWRAYKIHKRQTGTQALANYYHAVKSAAAAAGQPDFLVTGNDFAGYNAGWARGELDMVNTEVSWTPAWNHASGRFGYQPPPLGSYVPVYKKAREQAKGRFGHFWHYVPDSQAGRPGIADVLSYQALANHMLPRPFAGGARAFGGALAGNDDTTAAFHAFVGGARATFGPRTGVEEIGVYHSSSSELANMTLDGWPPSGFMGPGHSLAFLGWGTALTWLHQQWRAIPEWKLTASTLAGLKLLVIPSSEVFDPQDLPVIQDWVTQGGRLIVTGNSGSRAGEPGNFEKLSGYSLAKLTGVSTAADTRPQVLTKSGGGTVLYIRSDMGAQFTNLTTSRPDQLAAFAAALNSVGFEGSVVAPAVAYTVGITLYDDAGNLRRFVDVNNTNIDLDTDRIAVAPTLTFEVALPSWLTSRSVAAHVLSPDAGAKATVQQTRHGLVTIELSGLVRYASIVLQPSAAVPRVTAVVNNATFAAGPVAPGSIASIFGANFASGLQQAAGAPLPVDLAGVKVAIGSVAAPLLFVSENQIGVQVPYEAGLGTQSVAVTVNDKASNAMNVDVAAAAPYLLVTREGWAVAQNADGSLNGAENGAPAGTFLVCYLTGIGVPSPPVRTGAPTPADQLYRAAGAASATIGGRPATLLFLGLTPSFVGLAQANVDVPAGLAPGSYPLIVELAGKRSNEAVVTVR